MDTKNQAHPIQPILKKDCLRFKENKIVSHLLEFSQKHGCGLNEIAVMDFSKEDRQQLAQLIGYSLSGYSELTSYVDDDAYNAARLMAEKGISEERAKIMHLEKEIRALRKALLKPVARLFGIHEDDLKQNL